MRVECVGVSRFRRPLDAHGEGVTLGGGAARLAAEQPARTGLPRQFTPADAPGGGAVVAKRRRTLSEKKAIAEWERTSPAPKTLRLLAKSRAKQRGKGIENDADLARWVRGMAWEALNRFGARTAESEKRATEAWKHLAQHLQDAPPTSDEHTAQLRQLLAQPVWPVRFAMYPHDKTGGPR